MQVETSGRRGRRLVLVGPWPAPWGGIAVHMRALRQLALRNGYTVEVFDTGEGHALRSGADGVHDAGDYRRFAGAILGLARGDALLHVHMPGNNAKAWLVALAASLARPGGLLSVHSGLAPSLLDRSPAVRQLARQACAGYTRILCANEGIAAALGRSGVSSSRLEVVPAFIADALEPGDAPAVAARARSRFEPLLVAALAPGVQYGEDVLLEGVRILRTRLPRLGCIVYGPGTAAPEFAGRVGRLGIEARVVALGEIDQRASLAVMGLADVFVRSTRADGDSISVREALGLGVRVVASDVGHRPPGTTIFRAGDPEDLAAGIEAALASPPPRAGAGDDASERILSAWRSFEIAGESHGANP